jgi:hypothetical protein
MTTPAPPSGARGIAAVVLPLYTLTLFLSAFLLFGVQPMFTKMVLPLLGGSAAVWNTAVVFFQATLLAGYFYAHVSTKLLGLRRQAILHGVVLLLAFVALPIGVASGWTPPTTGMQIPWLIGLLAASIGLPFFVVSATAPLLQKWFVHTDHPAAGDPYFLYGGSNLGSLAALLSYPFLVEPALGLTRRGSRGRSAALLVLAIGTCAAILWRPTGRRAPSVAAEQAGLTRSHPGGCARAGSALPRASALLLGVTLHIGTDIAAAPFLWVLPLALYLLTFVLVFARRPILPQRWLLRAQVVSVALVVVLYQTPDLYALLVLHVGAMFFTAMVCHGELARLRPSASHLTEFYLWMSVGGVIGGFLVGIVAPLVLDDVYEYPIALLAGLLLRPHRVTEGRLAAAFGSLTGLERNPAARGDRPLDPGPRAPARAVPRAEGEQHVAHRDRRVAAPDGSALPRDIPRVLRLALAVVLVPRLPGRPAAEDRARAARDPVGDRSGDPREAPSEIACCASAALRRVLGQPSIPTRPRTTTGASTCSPAARSSTGVRISIARSGP